VPVFIDSDEKSWNIDPALLSVTNTYEEALLVKSLLAEGQYRPALVVTILFIFFAPAGRF
jgi:hypothetical protein